MMDEEGEMETDEKMDDSATVFTMDDVSRSASKYSSQSCNEFELAHTLDILMEQLYCFVRDFCALDVEPSSWNHHRTLFKELLDIFETQMLLVHGSHHVQFFVFFLCSLRPPTFAELFLSKNANLILFVFSVFNFVFFHRLPMVQGDLPI
jgi:RNA polymerase I-specific transcription initiation factor RRN3